MKRWVMFALTNVAVIIVLGIVSSVFGLDRYYSQYGLNYQALAIFCLFWGMGGAFISLMISKWMAKKFMGVKIVSPTGPYGEVVRMVHTFAARAGLPKMPEVGIYESPDVNAFATGPSKSNSLVAVSTGLLTKMKKEEVEGVVAHEVAHIANGDMVTMALIQGVLNAFVMFLARVAAFAIDNALRGDDEEGGLGFFGFIAVRIVLEIALGILATIVVAYFSRWREFHADKGGADLAGKEKMIAALESLKRSYPEISGKTEASMQAMQISSKSSWLALFSTHPPLDRRILALKQSTL